MSQKIFCSVYFVGISSFITDLILLKKTEKGRRFRNIAMEIRVLAPPHWYCLITIRAALRGAALRGIARCDMLSGKKTRTPSTFCICNFNGNWTRIVASMHHQCLVPLLALIYFLKRSSSFFFLNEKWWSTPDFKIVKDFLKKFTQLSINFPSVFFPC